MSAAVTEGADSTPLSLPAEGVDGRARAAALDLLRSNDRSPTTVVTYESHGSVLVIGEPAPAHAAARRLSGEGLRATVLTVQGRAVSVRDGEAGVTLVSAPLDELDGYLGNFVARVSERGEPVNLARFLGHGRDAFDLVVDLEAKPRLAHETPPPGYFAPRDAVAVEQVLQDLPGLVGEFDKPKYFAYKADICAHGASGLSGCRRCLDACPTLAITSLGDRIEVDPHLCQGAGICASACPTGAITYVYPKVSELLDELRRALHRYHSAGGGTPVVLFYDAEQGRRQIAAAAAALPEHVLPVEIEEVGAVGMDIWLALLAYGAHQVLWLEHSQTPRSVARELAHQLGVARALLTGMGYPAERIDVVTADHEDGLAARLPPPPGKALVPPTGFAAFDEKRTTIRLAIDHLYEHAASARKVMELPAGAPFGEIKVDRDACTLCMGCVSVCPAAALGDGDDLPKLLFTEANCVQCGLCATACPEDAIALAPRYCYDTELRTSRRVLNEEAPFNCIRCGKPFTTRSMMERIRQKLQNHWMYQNPEQRQRLEMCEDCRVADMYVQGGALEVYEKPDKPPGIKG